MQMKTEGRGAALLKEAVNLKKKVSIFEERLRKIDEHRTEVAQDIFFRVKEEYEARKGEIKDKLDALTTALRDQSELIAKARKVKETQLEELERKFQEYKLRHIAGEISDENFKTMEERYTTAKEGVDLFLAVLTLVESGPKKKLDHKASETVFAVFSEIAGEKKKPTNPGQKPGGEGHFTRMQRLQDIFGEGELEAMQHEKGTMTLPGLFFDAGPMAGKLFGMEEDRVSIGRVADNQIQIDGDTSVSRYHAEIINNNGIFVVKDLNSSNGTMVNGRLITAPHKLNGGDQVTVGESIILFITDPNDKHLQGYTVKGPKR